MLQLTCNNDHNTLKAVLEYGEEIGGLGPIWEPIKSADRTKKYDIENVAKKEKETIKTMTKASTKLAKTLGIELVFNGTYSSEYNPIERLWAWAKKRFVRACVEDAPYHN